MKQYMLATLLLVSQMGVCAEGPVARLPISVAITAPLPAPTMQWFDGDLEEHDGDIALGMIGLINPSSSSFGVTVSCGDATDCELRSPDGGTLPIIFVNPDFTSGLTPGSVSGRVQGNARVGLGVSTPVDITSLPAGKYHGIVESFFWTL